MLTPIKAIMMAKSLHCAQAFHFSRKGSMLSHLKNNAMSFSTSARSPHYSSVPNDIQGLSLSFNKKPFVQNRPTMIRRYLAEESIETTKITRITENDCKYMQQAVEAAGNGVGNTYPNPAVGCVIVSHEEGEDKIIGQGFHPKAGYPHAEVFALLEACGHVSSGFESALEVVMNTKNSNIRKMDGSKSSNNEIMLNVESLRKIYASEDGASKLFGGSFEGKDVTAYVTLEPCCHYGQTPPCAVSLSLAGVKRVVVGVRDPNPRVDGGGCAVLEENGIAVDLMSTTRKQESKVSQQCARIVNSFVKRISPRTEEELANLDYDTSMTGAKRSTLRKLAGQMKNEGRMTELSWPKASQVLQGDSIDFAEEIDRVTLDHSWIEAVDNALWEKELILLRLNGAVAKKKVAKLLGERIAKELDAHVAQVVGHTTLLYRPGIPPTIDLSNV